MYWIQDDDHDIAIIPRPRGGDWLEDDLNDLFEEGIDHLVSLLTAWEDFSLGLEDEQRLCKVVGMDWHHFSIEESESPSSSLDAIDLLRTLRAACEAGETVAFHSKMGSGRSLMMAAGLLVLCGASPADAWARVSTASASRSPRDTPGISTQREWLDSLKRFIDIGF